MIALVDPFTGAAGDMLLAALLDAGAPADDVRASIAATGLPGWALRTELLLDHGMAAVRVHVDVDDDATSRSASTLLDFARRAQPEPVARAAVTVIELLARTEARLHGTEPEHVHLHEIGGHDTIVDIVGVCAALHHLGVDQLFVTTPLPMGTGTVATRHGVLPLPAPATAELLAGLPVAASPLPGETVTPTGAALLVGLGARWDAAPPMTLVATGYGAGGRRLPDRPNVVVVRTGEPLDQGVAGALLTAETLVELETTVDDVTGELLGHVVTRTLAAGAADAWIVPVTMKKSRPGHVVHVLARPVDAPALRQILLLETGSLGVRSRAVQRHTVQRQISTVQVDGHDIRVKIGPHGAKPEYDDLAAAAAELDLPIREVARRAMREVSAT